MQAVQGVCSQPMVESRVSPRSLRISVMLNRNQCLGSKARRRNVSMRNEFDNVYTSYCVTHALAICIVLCCVVVLQTRVISRTSLCSASSLGWDSTNLHHRSALHCNQHTTIFTHSTHSTHLAARDFLVWCFTHPALELLSHFSIPTRRIPLT